MSCKMLHWCCLLLCLACTRIPAQPTTDQYTSDDTSDTSYQVSLLKQTVALLHSMDGRLQSLEKQCAKDDGIADHTDGVRCRWSNGKRTCYKLVNRNMTWSDARTYCRSFVDGGDLVSVESRAEHFFLIYITLELQHHCHVFYTSGRRDSTGAWVWGATGQPFTYTAWGPGQPDNYMDGQDTCSIYDWNGPNRHLLWDDVDDDERVCFMCEFP